MCVGSVSITSAHDGGGMTRAQNPCNGIVHSPKAEAQASHSRACTKGWGGGSGGFLYARFLVRRPPNLKNCRRICRFGHKFPPQNYAPQTPPSFSGGRPTTTPGRLHLNPSSSDECSEVRVRVLVCFDPHYSRDPRASAHGADARGTSSIPCMTRVRNTAQAVLRIYLWVCGCVGQ